MRVVQMLSQNGNHQEELTDAEIVRRIRAGDEKNQFFILKCSDQNKLGGNNVLQLWM